MATGIRKESLQRKRCRTRFWKGSFSTQSASSDVEEEPKQVGTCSRGGVLGVPEQLSVSPSDQELPGQSVPEDVVHDNTSAAFVQVGTFSAGEVLGVAQRRSG
eukprot:4377917-Amphidinium_carterae.1